MSDANRRELGRLAGEGDLVAAYRLVAELERAQGPRLVFDIPGEPVAKGRPRIGRNRHTGRPVNITPEETVRFESRASHAAWLAMHDRKLAPLTGGVALEIDAFFGALASSKDTVPTFKTTKPDGSNVAKAIEDAMNRVVFQDDARVARLVVNKWWAPKGEPARTRVAVRSLAGEWGP